MEQCCNTFDLIRPLSARSVVLSYLLGAHPPSMPAKRLVAVGSLFGIAEGTIRVALSRMSAAGDLQHDDDRYALSQRLTRRQQQQDASRRPRTVDWYGDWQLVAVTASGRSRSDRDAFRSAMRGRRFAELREGLWLRPDNLAESGETSGDDYVEFIARPRTHPKTLVTRLWDLTGWAERARGLIQAMDGALELPTTFAVSAAVLPHLLIDPVLPAELLPRDWPGEALRERYADFDARFRQELEARLR